MTYYARFSQVPKRWLLEQEEKVILSPDLPQSRKASLSSSTHYAYKILGWQSPVLTISEHRWNSLVMKTKSCFQPFFKKRLTICSKLPYQFAVCEDWENIQNAVLCQEDWLDTDILQLYLFNMQIDLSLRKHSMDQTEQRNWSYFSCPQGTWNA